uniref:Metalloendopeptidase n=1 Tax=Parastrongyloides trichosuri TaxID=131310 RepID=A0A0N4Z3E2_PARTI
AYGSIINDTTRQWKLPIQYSISSSLYGWYIRKALEIFSTYTCVKFQENYYLKDSDHGIKFLYGDTCRSDFIGRKSNEVNKIYINNDCNFIYAWIQGLIMEALGVFPEQTRTDRDKFVEIKYENIDYKRYPGVSTYMDINWPHNTSNYDTKYEYGSVVQYISKAFSKNGELTILAKGEHAVRHQQMMGQKYNVAFQDYKLINRHFCNKKCEKQLGCWRGGYEDPNNCWKCICPFPFENNICDGLLKNDDGCSFRYERASDIKRFLSFVGWKSCYGYIVAPSNDYRVELNITRLHMTKYEICTRDNSMVEIKYLADK